jgi:hypothetical protein
VAVGVFILYIDVSIQGSFFGESPCGERRKTEGVAFKLKLFFLSEMIEMVRKFIPLCFKFIRRPIHSWTRTDSYPSVKVNKLVSLLGLALRSSVFYQVY